MDNGFIYGVLALMGVQFLTAIFGIAIYTRQKSALSLEQRDRGEFRPLVQKALSLAGDAIAGIDRIDVEQYKVISRKLGEALAEIELLKAQIVSLKGSIESAHNKLANFSRNERNERNRDTAPRGNVEDTSTMPGVIEIPEGIDPLEWMKAQGIAKPAGGQVAFQQQVMPLNSMPRGFGKQVAR